MTEKKKESTTMIGIGISLNSDDFTKYMNGCGTKKKTDFRFTIDENTYNINLPQLVELLKRNNNKPPSKVISGTLEEECKSAFLAGYRYAVSQLDDVKDKDISVDFYNDYWIE